MAFWLLKSEPDVFSIDHLIAKKDQKDSWDGVRNYQARNFIAKMKPFDLAFFYHSNASPPGIIGVVEIISLPYPDRSAFDASSVYYDLSSKIDQPRWLTVDVQFKEKYAHLLSLEFLKQHIDPKDCFLVQKGSRLSVMPISSEVWKRITEELRFF